MVTIVNLIDKVHHDLVERKKIISRKLKYIFTKKTTPQFLEHTWLQNMGVGVKANFRRLAAVCLMHADISS